MRTILLCSSLVFIAACAAKTAEGSVTIGGDTVVVTREGDLVAGSTTTFACKVNDGAKVDDVQAWYGREDDTQRTTCDYDSKDGDYDCDVAIASVTTDAKLFIVVTKNGSSETGSIAVH